MFDINVKKNIIITCLFLFLIIIEFNNFYYISEGINDQDVITTKAAVTKIAATKTAAQAIKYEQNINNGNCSLDMIEIKGDYCNSLEEICLKYGDPGNKCPNGPAQCLEFKHPTRCLSSTTALHFCIDKFPYPYHLDEKPATNMNWYDAKKICETQGKRLCGRREYTQACRGPENKPYPYGYTRNCDKCNCDRIPWLDPSTHSFDQLDKRVQIKDVLSCASDYGIIGLVGNNDRWVYNESERPYKCALVGGHSILGARNRCSVATLVHNENFKYYEVATPLCCSDIKL